MNVVLRYLLEKFRSGVPGTSKMKAARATAHLARRRRQSFLESLEDRRLMTTTAAKFDFGLAATDASVLEAGFTRVQPGTIYPTAAGFGWNAAVPGAADQSISSSLTDYNLKSDYNTGTLNATFQVNVDPEPQQYDVRIVSGNASFGSTNVKFTAEGAPTDTFSTTAGTYYDHTYRVTVSDGTLEMSLNGS